MSVAEKKSSAIMALTILLWATDKLHHVEENQSAEHLMDAELVVEDGVTGILVPPGDVAALTAALEPLMRDGAAAAAMGARARQRVVTMFSLDAEANGIAQVYRTLL